MKNKYDVSLLFNPFVRIAGLQAFGTGAVLFVISTAIACLGGIIFDGIISVHLASVSMLHAFALHGTSILALILVMYIAGLIFSQSAIRFIDVAGTMTLARIPFLVIGLIIWIPGVTKSWDEVVRYLLESGISADISTICVFIISILLIIICIIWFVVLAYNAFRVSCNIKGLKGKSIFTISFLIAIVISTVTGTIIVREKSSVVVTADLQATNKTVTRQDYTNINNIGLQVAKYISEGKYNEVMSYFDDKLKENIPAEKLKEVMNEMEARYGKIISIGNEAKNVQAGGYDLALVPVKFEKKELYFRFTFNEENQIAGFFM